VRTQHLTTLHRHDGRQQIAYYGHPLYTMSADTRPGQLEGEGFGGAWFAVSPTGKAVVAPGTRIKKGGGY
jgi:predicted lipoprotein with Yx(FWY)xxD motif